MSNSYVASAFVITVNAREARHAELAFRGSEMLCDADRLTNPQIADELGSDFMALFPPTPTDPDNPLSGFLDAFEDWDYFGLGCTLEAIPLANDAVDLWIAGDQIQVETVAALLQRCCPSAVPFAFEWACYSDKLRRDEFGGGHAIVTADDRRLITTSDLMDRALARESGEGADGFVLEQIAMRQSSYLGEKGDFGRLSEARVFTNREAAAFDLSILHGRELAWRAMPRPLGL